MQSRLTTHGCTHINLKKKKNLTFGQRLLLCMVVCCSCCVVNDLHRFTQRNNETTACKVNFFKTMWVLFIPAGLLFFFFVFFLDSFVLFI